MATSKIKMMDNWQAEDDARTMARYQEILSDRTRMNNAIKAAKAQAKDLSARASAMTKVASSSRASSSKKK